MSQFSELIFRILIKVVRLVPYRLPQILKESSVFIVEGEKDADNLWKIGIPSTCNPMGAGKWHQEWSKFFEGKEVSILPDLDAPGRKHAVDVGKKLFGQAHHLSGFSLPIMFQDGAIPANWHQKKEPPRTASADRPPEPGIKAVARPGPVPATGSGA